MHVKPIAAWMLAGILCGGLCDPSRADRPGAGSEQPAADESSSDKDEHRAQMHARAAKSVVRLVEKKDGTTAALLDEPVLQYTDQPRRIVDATLWVWTSEGRPAALCKIEHYDHGDPAREWLYCLTSLSTGKIEFQSPGGHRWTARQPGLTIKPVPESPPPATSRNARMRQLKELSRRFSSTMLDPTAGTRQEMRLLPQPLLRFGDGGDVQDGAVFGLTSNGTNPDALVQIDVRKSAGGQAAWHYGITGMTDGGLSVRLDESEIWSKPQQTGVSDHETWTFFWERDAGR